MLYVFFGSDRQGAVDAARAKAQEHGEVNTIDEQNFQPGQFEELTTAASLFGEAQTYVIDTPSSSVEFNEACQSVLGDFASSANNFYIVEGSLLAAAKKKYAKHAESVEEFVADKPERFNTFSLADALARRDKKKLWMLSQEATLLGVREEEIIGILWWQLKALRLASVTASASEAGMKDYPYKKAKQSLKNFSDGDITDLSQSLLEVYHDGHKGISDIGLGLESWILNL